MFKSMVASTLPRGQHFTHRMGTSDNILCSSATTNIDEGALLYRYFQSAPHFNAFTPRVKPSETASIPHVGKPSDLKLLYITHCENLSNGTTLRALLIVL